MTQVNLDEVMLVIHKQKTWTSHRLTEALIRYFGGVSTTTAEEERVAFLMKEGWNLSKIAKETGLSPEKVNRVIAEISQRPILTQRPVAKDTVLLAMRRSHMREDAKPWNAILDYLTSRNPRLDFVDFMDDHKVFRQHRSEVRAKLRQVQEQLYLIVATKEMGLSVDCSTK